MKKSNDWLGSEFFLINTVRKYIFTSILDVSYFDVQ